MLKALGDERRLQIMRQITENPGICFCRVLKSTTVAVDAVPPYEAALRSRARPVRERWEMGPLHAGFGWNRKSRKGIARYRKGLLRRLLEHVGIDPKQASWSSILLSLPIPKGKEKILFPTKD